MGVRAGAIAQTKMILADSGAYGHLCGPGFAKDHHAEPKGAGASRLSTLKEDEQLQAEGLNKVPLVLRMGMDKQACSAALRVSPDLERERLQWSVKTSAILSPTFKKILCASCFFLQQIRFV